MSLIDDIRQVVVSDQSDSVAVDVALIDDIATLEFYAEQGPKGDSGINDHHILINLADGDDHPQYLNDERGDARYEPVGQAEIAANAAMTSEANARASADTALGTSISAEATARTAADASLSTQISTEVTNRQTQDTAEANARTSADSALQTALTSEATTRTNADAALSTRINAEATARAAADTAHITDTDPHPEYLTQTEGNSLYAPIVGGGYLSETEADGRYDAIGDANSAYTASVTYTNSQVATRIPLSQRGAANGVATLDANGILPTSQLPALAITDVIPVANQAAMLALTPAQAQRGDVANLASDGSWWMLRADDPSVLANWGQLTVPGVVTTVNGHAGPVVSLTAADVGALTQTQGDARYDINGAAGIVQANLTSETIRAISAEGLAAQKANNLSDLSNAATARANLGLGSAATQSSSAFDVFGAASIVQSNLTAEISRATTAEALAALKANNLSDLSNIVSARANLGLDTAATQPSSAFDAAGAAAAVQASLTSEITRATTAEGLAVHLAGTETITGLKTFQPSALGVVGLIVKGVASQSADLQQWQNSSAQAVTAVNNTGQLVSRATDGTDVTYIDSSGINIGINGAAQAKNPTLSVSSFTGGYAFTARQMSGIAGSFSTGGGSGVGTPATKGSTSVVGSTTTFGYALAVGSGYAAQIPVAVQGFASQSGDMTQWLNSTGTILQRVTATGQTQTHGVTNTFGALVAPTITVTPTGTTGAITYGYRVSAVNAAGETVAAATVTTATGNATLSGTNFNQLSWAPINGATSYKIYGRTSGSELFMATVASDGRATNYTYNDTGAATPAGALPGNPVGTKLVVQGWANQTANAIEIQDSTGAVVASLKANGLFNAGTFFNVGAFGAFGNNSIQFSSNGTLTGNINMDGSGGQITNPLIVPGSTAGIGMSIKGLASQTGDLQQWNDSTSTILQRVTASGQSITHGVTNTFAALVAPTITVTPQGTTGSTTYGYRVSALNSAGETIAAATVTTATGNAVLSGTNFNQLSWAPVNGATSYKVYGRTSGSELFMATVVSNGRTANYTYNDTGAATPSGALPAAPTGTKLVVQGWASQSGNVQEWQDSTGAVKALVKATGDATFNSVSASQTTAQTSYFGPATTSGNTVGIASLDSSKIPLIIKGAASQAANLQEWQNSLGAVVAKVDPAGNIFAGVTTGNTYSRLGYDGIVHGSQGARFGYPILNSGRVSIQQAHATDINLVMRAFASGSGDFVDIQNSSGVLITKIKYNGEYESAVNAVADTDVNGGTGGIVLKSPNGTRYRITVADDGSLTSTAA